MPDSGNLSIGNRNVCRINAACKDIHNLCIPQNQLGWNLILRYINQTMLHNQTFLSLRLHEDILENKHDRKHIHQPVNLLVLHFARNQIDKYIRNDTKRDTFGD